MVIRFAPNKNNNQKVVQKQAVWRGTNCYVKISLSIWKFQQFARFNGILMLKSFMRANWGLSKTK